MNLFSSGSNQDEIIRRERISTRIYIAVLVVSILIIIIYTTVPVNTVTETVNNPNLMQYEQLMKTYRSALHCSCSQIAVLYQTFVKVDVTYHQICTGDFVSERWILYLSLSSYSTFKARTDFLVTSSAYFQLLSVLCQLVQTTVQNSIDDFLFETFLNTEIISEDQFISRMKDKTNQLENRTVLLLSNPLELVRAVVHGNSYVSSYALNWYFWVNDTRPFMAVESSPMTLHNNCSCGTNRHCSDPDAFSSFIPGWVLGCSIVETLFKSTLEALYNQTWIDNLVSYMMNRDPEIFQSINNFTAMNHSLPSRFNLNTTVQKIFDGLFTERWQATSSFSSFYEQCAPLYCEYTIDGHRNILFLISRILGLYGGLTISLRFIVSSAVKLFYRIKLWIFRNQFIRP